MTLKEDIFEQFQRYHKGKNNPIKIIDLYIFMNRCFNWNPISKRAVRQVYEDLPICGSSKGLYLPGTKAEIDEQIKLHWKKIYSYFRKIDVLENYHLESDSVQKDLF